jgi:hypothetical protein
MRSLLAVVFTLTIVQFSSAQTFSWAGKMDLTSPESVYADVDGNVYTTGYFTGTVDFDPGPGVTNLTAMPPTEGIYVQKIDSLGNLTWAKHMAGSLNGEGFSIATDSYKNVYLIGYFRGTVDFDPGEGLFNLSSTAPSFNDLFILKLDVDGNFVWARQLKNVYQSTPSASLAVDGNGNVYCTGFFSGTVDFDPGDGYHPAYAADDYVGFVLKLDAYGNFIWVDVFSSVSTGIAIATRGDDVYVTGSFLETIAFAGSPATLYSSKGWVDAFLLKLNTTGEFVWAKQMGGPGGEYGRSIALDADGNIFLAGDFEQTSDFNVGGTATTLTSAGKSDIFLQKFDPAGNLVWVKQIGGPESDLPERISVSTITGSLFLSGSFVGLASFNIGATPKMYNSINGSVFMVRVNSSEEIDWIVQYKTYRLKMAAEGRHLYAAGQFSSTMDFDPGPGNTSITPNAFSSAFVVRFEGEADLIITGAEDFTKVGFSVYPNPVNSIAIVDLSKMKGHEYTARIKDVHGRIIKELSLENHSKNQIDMTGLSDGLYFVELTQSGNKVNMMRLIKN